MLSYFDLDNNKIFIFLVRNFLCPALISEGIARFRQEAAVMTYLDATKVPPQLTVQLISSSRIATIQGYLFTLNEKIIDRTRKLK